MPVNDPDPTKVGTTVLYNGVRLVNCHTKQFDQEIMYDSSGVDYVASKFTMQFTCLVHVQNLGKAIVRTDLRATSPNALQMLDEIQRLLAIPRKVLTIQSGGRDWLVFEPPEHSVADHELEIDNGPHPRKVKVSLILADEVYEITVDFEAWSNHCAQKNLTRLVTNRWSIGESMDEDMHLTKRLEGEVRMVRPGIVGQARALVLPPLEKGFKRMGVDFVCHPNGLDASYSMTDKQITTAAPWPATSIKVTHHEIMKLDAPPRTANIRVELTGAVNAHAGDLILRGLQVVDARVNGGLVAKKTAVFVRGATLTHVLGEKTQIIVDVVIQWNPVGLATYDSTPIISVFGQNLDTLGKPLLLSPQVYNRTFPRYDRAESPAPPAYGLFVGEIDPSNPLAGIRNPALFLALQCVVRSGYREAECNPVSDLQAQANEAFSPGEAKNDQGVEDTDYDYPVRVRPTEKYPKTQQNNVYESPSSASSKSVPFFTVYRIESTYRRPTNKCQLPLAGYPSGASDHTCFVATLGAVTEQREILVDAESINAPPKLPAPLEFVAGPTGGANTGPDQTLLYWEMTAQGARPNANGDGLVHHVSARYLYALSRPVKDGELLPIGINPQLDPTKSQPLMLAGYFDPSIGP